MKPNKDDALLAYIAGFFDGEGSVVILSRLQERSKNPTYSLIVSIANTVLKPLRMLHSVYGGVMHKAGKVVPRQKQVYHWRLNGKRAADFLTDIRHFLIIKKRQALIGIDFQNRKENVKVYRGHPISKTEVAYRERQRTALRKLNKRGA